MRMATVIEKAPPEPAVETKEWIGRGIERKEDERLLRGLGRFVDDVDDPLMLHMAVGRCPFPRARILSVDATSARELDGVAAVLLGPEVVERTEPSTVLRPLPDVPRLLYYAMAEDVALWEGQPVVSVVASDRYVAEDAVDLIDVDYEPLPHVVDAVAGLEPGAPVLHEQLESNLLVANPRGKGDPEAAFARADVIVGDRFVINRVTGLPMEGRGVVARYTPGLRTLDVRSSTQVPHVFRRQLALALRIPEAEIRVVAPDLGGGFGLKLGIYPEDVLACLHSIDLGRPVKWIEDRTEHFRSSTHAREAVHDAEIAATKDGRIIGMRDVYVVDGGAYNSSFGSPMLSSFMFTGPYYVEDAYTERRVAVTNKTPVGAYRGYGQPESNFVRELLVDRLASILGEDPLEIRRQNLVPREAMPWKSPGGALYDSGDYSRCLDLAAERIDYSGVRAQQAALRSEGRYLGAGLSCYVEMTGYPGSDFLGKHGAQYGAHESVTIRANRSGGVDLYTGVSPMGQSTETAYAQVCASVIGIGPNAVRVHAGDTLGTPYNTGSFASRTLIAGAGAINAAGTVVREKAIRVAAHLLDIPIERLELVDGVVRASDGSDARIPLAEIATEAIFGHKLPPGDDPGLEATAYFDPSASAFGYGTAAAVVEVDPRTGEFEIQRLVFVHDCGLQVNPTIVEGQVHGGIAQALGAGLFEELLYDPESGQLLNGTMVDYFMPTAADLPAFELDHTETPSPVTPFGIRGIGESGTIPPAAAVANAICDALGPFRVEISRLPITPEAVWRALERARQQA
jgi:aerobic carbon-monoxide dehydrogenase large subunit